MAGFGKILEKYLSDNLATFWRLKLLFKPNTFQIVSFTSHETECPFLPPYPGERKNNWINLLTRGTAGIKPWAPVQQAHPEPEYKQFREWG